MRYALARRWLPSGLRRFLYSFEALIEDSVSALAGGLPAGARVLDAGAGEGQYSEHFRRQRYTGVDLGIGDAAWSYARLDAIADLTALPFRAGTFDAALSIVTLEHLRDPLAALRETARVLAPGGVLLLVAPMEWEVHQAPHDYFRYTRHGLEYLLRESGLRVEELQPAGGIFRLLARRLLNASQLQPWLLPLLGPLALLLGLLDGLDRRKDSTLGYKCIARKL
ncbi:MAG: class I SAM-dependent methyltransferase [Acidobacteria bacterium]|nr:class I SAM-dependent methyltransferase [Acidobacteriota bacterium]